MVVVGRDRCSRPPERAKKRRGQADQRPRDQGNLRPLLQGAGPPGARRAFRLAARLPGRASRLHDDGRRAAAGGRSARREGPGGHREAPRLQAPARAANSRRSRKARRPDYLQGALVAMDPATGHVRAHGRRPRLQREPLQPRGAGQAAVGLGVQAVRLRGRARGRLSPGVGDHESQRSDRDAAGRLGAGGRALDARAR